MSTDIATISVPQGRIQDPPIEIVAMQVGDGNKLKAVATVKIGDVMIDDVKVVEHDSRGLWLTVPKLPRRDGGWKTIISITNPTTWQRLRAAVFAAYREMEAGDE
jgi:DNA-binding cell septation regulator SpoVG